MDKQKQLEKLQAIIDNGLVHFIIVRGIIFYGSILLVAQLLTKWLIRNEPLTTQFYLFMLASSVVSGFVFGLMQWPSIERKAHRLKKELSDGANRV